MPKPSPSPRRWLPVALLCLLLAGGAAWLLRGPGPGANPDELWIVGLDGADWDILLPMVDHGELPHLARLLEEGTRAELVADPPLLSPILWTTIASGRSAADHGVSWFVEEAGDDGQRQPVSQRAVQVHRLWEIASREGVRSGVVGWWATWPAVPLEGGSWLLGDRIGWHSFLGGLSGERPTGLTWPAGLEDELESLPPDPGGLPRALTQRLLPSPVDGVDPGLATVADRELRLAAATSRAWWGATLEQLERRRPGLLVLYIEAPDLVQHLFQRLSPPQLASVDDAEFRWGRDVVREHWRWQDEQLGRLLAERGERTTIMLVSDHGFRRGNERLEHAGFEVERADDDHLPGGILLLHGPGIRAGHTLDSAHQLDITPTALALLGIEPSAEMPGRVLRDALEADRAARLPAGRRPSWEDRPLPQGEGEDPNQAEATARLEETLRSVGYIGGEAEHGRSPEEAVNHAIALRREGRLDEAATELEAVLAKQPGFVAALGNLARVRVEQRRMEEATRLYREALRHDPSDLAHREDLARCLALSGRVDAALGVLEEGLEQQPGWAMGHCATGLALVARGRLDEAAGSFDRAIEADPTLAEAHYGRGLLLARRAKGEGAIASLRRALELDPSHGLAAAELGAQLLAAGQAREALGWLEQALRERPGDINVLGNTAIACVQLDDPAGAEAYCRRILAIRPGDPRARAMLGQLDAWDQTDR